MCSSFLPLRALFEQHFPVCDRLTLFSRAFVTFVDHASAWQLEAGPSVEPEARVRTVASEESAGCDEGSEIAARVAFRSLRSAFCCISVAICCVSVL